MNDRSKDDPNSGDPGKKLVEFVLKMSQDPKAALELRKDPEGVMALHDLSDEERIAVKKALDGDPSRIKELAQGSDKHKRIPPQVHIALNISLPKGSSS